MKAAEISAYCRERFTKNGLGPAVIIVMPPENDSLVCEWAISPPPKNLEEKEAVIEALRAMAGQLENNETQTIGVCDVS